MTPLTEKDKSTSLVNTVSSENGNQQQQDAKGSNKSASLASFMVFTICLGMAFVFAALFVMIMATDGLANLRGEPETGWGAIAAIFFLVPLISVFSIAATVTYRKYKQYK